MTFPNELALAPTRSAGTQALPGYRARATGESKVVRGLLIAGALGFLALFVFVPLVAVFAQAMGKGLSGYLRGITDPDTLAAIKLTLLTAGVAVPLNLIFGVAAAWAIAKFDFHGKSILITLIDLPFAV